MFLFIHQKVGNISANICSFNNNKPQKNKIIIIMIVIMMIIIIIIMMMMMIIIIIKYRLELKKLLSRHLATK